MCSLPGLCQFQTDKCSLFANCEVIAYEKWRSRYRGWSEIRVYTANVNRIPKSKSILVSLIEFKTMNLDGTSTSGLTPNKTNWAAPIKMAPFYG